MMSLLGKCITNFNDAEMFAQAHDEFFSSHCPYRNDATVSKRHHFEVRQDRFIFLINFIIGYCVISSLLLDVVNVNIIRFAINKI